MPRAVVLSHYTLEAAPKLSPIDINLPELIQESGWNPSDRLRFCHTIAGTAPHMGLTIRKLDLDEKALIAVLSTW